VRLRRGPARRDGGGRGPYLSHPRHARREAVIEFLAGLGVVREAAVVARVFRQDPAMLLDDAGDEWAQLVRVACARYIIRQEEAAAREAKR